MAQLENLTVQKKYHTGLRNYNMQGRNRNYEKNGIPSDIAAGEHLAFYCRECGYGWIAAITN